MVDPSSFTFTQLERKHISMTYILKYHCNDKNTFKLILSKTLLIYYNKKKNNYKISAVYHKSL